ncbi:MAG: carboxylate--amine ligase [Acidobacteriota bacterium]|nr:carboxylate--amine ligase [Acidobacteriota bacterium]
MDRQFVPVLLGTEIGAYGMARAFWEAYGAHSVAYGTFPLTPTAYSKFIDQRCDPDFLTAARFVEVLNRDADAFGHATPLIIPCGDDYSVLLSEHKGELDERYVAICSDPGVLGELENKARFYALCEREGVPYPKTVRVDGPEVPELPFPFPVAVKPTNAALYREHPFEGQKKAFVIDDGPMLDETLRRIYASGYDEGLVIQDFIPGGDENMRVLNGYVRSDGSVSLLSLGHPILEDCAPMRIGNYVAIVSYGDEQVYEMVERLLGHVKYFGYFNIDMKYDARDGSFKLLDFNPRQGRSSFFTMLSGHNLACQVVEDVIEGKREAPVHATEEFLWVGVPRSIVRRYAAEGPAKDWAMRLMREGRVGTTLFGAHDNHPCRLWNMSKLWVHYIVDFKRHFGHLDLGE